jgi:hypothetical protein
MPSIYKYYNSSDSSFTFSIINKPVSSRVTKLQIGDSSNTISSNLNSGELSLSSSIIIEDNKTLKVNGIAGDNKFALIVSGDKVAINGNLSNTYNLDVTGSANISTDLYVGDELTVVGPLTSTSNLTVGSNKFVVTASSGNTSIAGDLSVTSDLKINTNKFVVTASSGNTNIAGNTSIAGDLSVTGAFLGRVPLGGVIAVLPVFESANNSGAKTHTGVPTTGNLTTDGYQLCDGALVNSGANSNFTSKYVPNLTDDRFIRGSILSNIGVTGGGTATLLETNLPAHTHTLSSATISSHNLSHSHNYLSGGGNIAIRQIGGGGTVVWFNASGFDTDILTPATQLALGTITPTLNSLTLNNTGSGTAFDVIPKYINAIYLMRVK